MKFIMIVGPPAVGKMAVGMELRKMTGFKLFHNHMTIELLLNFFEFGSPHFRRLDKKFRFGIFEEIAQSELPGLIFTFVWAFDQPGDQKYVEEICQIFESQDADIYFVELLATLPERIRRNKTKLRLQEKPSKRNIELSEQRMLQIENEYKMNSDETNGFPLNYPYIKLDTTDLSAHQTARQIKNTFQL